MGQNCDLLYMWWWAWSPWIIGPPKVSSRPCKQEKNNNNRKKKITQKKKKIATNNCSQAPLFANL